MKVLLNSHLPFMLAHGGQQIQIEQTKGALEEIGVEVEYLRWWDDRQTGDVLHHFARMPASHLQMAQRKGLKVVMAELLGGQGRRSVWQLKIQKFVVRTLLRLMQHRMITPLNWESYQLADGSIALTEWEAHLMRETFKAPRERVFVVPNGVEAIFFEGKKVGRSKWLVCTATITGVKRLLELGQAAVRAQTPLWVIGKPFSESDTYAQNFFTLVRQNREFIRYEGPVYDRAQLMRIYREARGFVLLSMWESLSLSALEAAACECPLLLSDLPWARTVFKDKASYCPVRKSIKNTAEVLGEFYRNCPALPIPSKPKTWIEVAEELKRVYETVLKTSR